jgi:hypothetical protein
MSDGFPSLTPTQINALVVLMAEARELTNNELKELAGFSLTGKDNAKLTDLGLVETDKSHRPYSHHLTDKGWKAMREQIHLAEPPKAGGSAARTLFTLLANLHRSLDRLHTPHGEFFKQTGAVVAHVPADDVEGRIRAAYADLARTPGEWIGLADLRDRIADLDRRTVDDALRTLLRRPGVRIIPVANLKSLTDRDRAAALRIGEEDNHTLSIGPA